MVDCLEEAGSTQTSNKSEIWVIPGTGSTDFEGTGGSHLGSSEELWRVMSMVHARALNSRLHCGEYEVAAGGQ